MEERIRALDLAIGDLVTLSAELEGPHGRQKLERLYRVARRPYGSSRSGRMYPEGGFLDEEVFLHLKEVEVGAEEEGDEDQPLGADKDDLVGHSNRMRDSFYPRTDYVNPPPGFNPGEEEESEP
jgi:hypothetical protein